MTLRQTLEKDLKSKIEMKSELEKSSDYALRIIILSLKQTKLSRFNDEIRQAENRLNSKNYLLTIRNLPGYGFGGANSTFITKAREGASIYNSNINEIKTIDNLIKDIQSKINSLPPEGVADPEDPTNEFKKKQITDSENNFFESAIDTFFEATGLGESIRSSNNPTDTKRNYTYILILVVLIIVIYLSKTNTKKRKK